MSRSRLGVAGDVVRGLPMADGLPFAAGAIAWIAAAASHPAVATKEFYSAAATIIPVLLLSLAFQTSVLRSRVDLSRTLNPIKEAIRTTDEEIDRERHVSADRRAALRRLRRRAEDADQLPRDSQERVVEELSAELRRINDEQDQSEVSLQRHERAISRTHSRIVGVELWVRVRLALVGFVASVLGSGEYVALRVLATGQWDSVRPLAPYAAIALGFTVIGCTALSRAPTE